MQNQTISVYEEYLFFSFVPKPAEADLGWLACDFDTDFGKGMEDEKWEVFFHRAVAKIQPYLIRRDPYRSHPRTNYVNWSEGLYHKGALQQSVYITIQDLKKTQIFDAKDLDLWWCDHLSKKSNYDKLLMNLSSLELLMKIGMFGPRVA